MTTFGPSKPLYPLFWLLSLLLICGCTEEPSASPDASTETTSASDPAPTDSEKPLTGVDVSHHSGEVDWFSVADAGFDFVFVKATEGIDNQDPLFREHWEALKNHDLMRGAYHFYVTEDDPEQQARFFLSTVDFEAGDLAPVVDIELIGHGTQPGLEDRLRMFLRIIEQETGIRPIIYTIPNFWNEHLGAGFEEYPLWVAEYDVDAPHLPQSWSAWQIWQHAGDADVPGVEKGADLSKVHPEVDLTSLRFGAE